MVLTEGRVPRTEEEMNVEGYILIDTEVGKAGAVAKEVAQLEGVLFTEVVTGPYDVVVRAERSCEHDLHCLDEDILAIPGVTRALACPLAPGVPAWSQGSPVERGRIPIPV